MEEMGLKFKIEKNKIEVFESGILKPISLKTSAYPGFPTDMQAQILTLACLSKGNSEVQENIFENRFMHIPELNRLGANISIKGNKAFIKGNCGFVGAEVMATDLRASVSLILAGLSAKGVTKVNRVYHLDRGYEKIDEKLLACGAEIYRKKMKDLDKSYVPLKFRAIDDNDLSVFSDCIYQSIFLTSEVKFDKKINFFYWL